MFEVTIFSPHVTNPTVCRHYLSREANSFPREKLEENCELRGTDDVQGQILVHIFEGKCILGDLFSKFFNGKVILLALKILLVWHLWITCTRGEAATESGETVSREWRSHEKVSLQRFLYFFTSTLETTGIQLAN